MVDRFQFAEEVEDLKAAGNTARLEYYLKMQLAALKDYIEFGDPSC